MIVFDDGAVCDLERIFEFQLARDPAGAVRQIDRIRGAIELLARHPQIGRRAQRRSTLRELVISRGENGYIALYEYSPVTGLIRVVAIRHQWEVGYRDR